MPDVMAFLRAARRSLMFRWVVVVAVMFGVITLLTEAVRIHGHAPLALRLLTAGDEHTIGTY